MPVTGSNQSTVTVQVPVPTPVQQKPKSPVSFGPAQGAAPQVQAAPVQGDDELPPHPAGSLSAVILPWNPQKKQFKRVGFEVVRYAAPVKRVVPLTGSEHLLPEESERLGGMKNESIKGINAGIRQGTGNKAGVLPTEREITSLAEVGEPARGGYRAQHDTFSKLLQHPGDADRWATINAILSANSPWESHTADAVEALAKWHHAGRPTDRQGLEKVFGTSTLDPKSGWIWHKTGTFQGTRSAYGSKGEKIKDFLARGSDYDGGVNWGDISEGSLKTPNFGKAFVDPKGVPIDTHMARLLTPGKPFTQSNLARMATGVGMNVTALSGLKNVRDKLATDPKVHFAYKTLISAASKKMGWEPREVQEAVWTSLLAIMALKHHDPETRALPTASRVLEKLSRQAVAAGWSLDDVLQSPHVEQSMKLYGVSPRRKKDALDILRSRKPTTTGRLGTSDPAALESAAVRLLPEVPDAARPISRAIKATWKGQRNQAVRMSRRRIVSTTP